LANLLALADISISLATPNSSRMEQFLAIASNSQLDCIAISGDDSAMRYPGGKGRLWQEIVSLMPPHEIYIETHLGGGAVLRNKRPAKMNIGIDVDKQVIAAAKHWEVPSLALHQADAVDFLEQYTFLGTELVYSDPPYVASTKAYRRYYRCEYTNNDHVRLLAKLSELDCDVLISGYSCELYESSLQGWNRKELTNVTHAGRRQETVWANFAFTDKLHDYNRIGGSFRERERIRRKIARWTDKIKAMPAMERNAILSALTGSTSEPVE
jgi:DNA adenine methylase